MDTCIHTPRAHVEIRICSFDSHSVKPSKDETAFVSHDSNDGEARDRPILLIRLQNTMKECAQSIEKAVEW